MSRFSPHISPGGGLRHTALVLFLLAGLVAVISVSAPRPASAQATGYGWPVKPFDRPHPVRANLGDPRTSFKGPRTLATLNRGTGIFQFHFGVDIAVSDFTPVYPVRSGVASLLSGRTVAVDSGAGRVMEYWHIVPCVEAGQHVVAYKTILGRAMKGYEHVHFTEREHGKALNPLAPGHLTPYFDTTTPTVRSITFRASAVGPKLRPELLHGRVVVVAEALDTPPIPVPGVWADLPVAPALVTWRVERASDGRIVVPRRTAFDVRRTLPRRPFWSLYVRGTRQNASNFGGHKAWREPGIYLYNLCAPALDTTRLPNGIYRLIVTVSDIRGNTSSAQQVVRIRNGQDV
ncbi:MAG TPA: M23 family metallopeptidase [Gaiellaceae bacterium]